MRRVTLYFTLSSGHSWVLVTLVSMQTAEGECLESRAALDEKVDGYLTLI
jgi:hypothetical protein